MFDSNPLTGLKYRSRNSTVPGRYVLPVRSGQVEFVTVFINEWLASNTNNLVDPADGDREGWIELYNPGTNAVDPPANI